MKFYDWIIYLLELPEQEEWVTAFLQMWLDYLMYLLGNATVLQTEKDLTNQNASLIVSVVIAVKCMIFDLVHLRHAVML